MIKKAKKSVAVGLSVALAVTSVNIPVNSASAAAKKAKLSATKKTLTAGKSTTLTLKTNKKKAKTIKSIKAKYVKVSTSKKSVATVKKVSKKSKFTGVKVTAKKAGKSTITVKVTKGTYKGTYKCTVTVKKKASATKKPTQKPTQKPTEAPTATPEVTVEPTQAPTQEPTAEPTTAPAITQTPIVQEVANVNAIVTNSVKGYNNTVLAGQDATIQVLVTDKQGNPVANDNVVLRFVPDVVNSNAYYQYEEKTNVATTNAKGIATFVVGPKQKKVKNSDSNYLGSYKFKVTEAAENIIDEGTLDVATISYTSDAEYNQAPWGTKSGDVLNLNGIKGSGYDEIVKGLNSGKTLSLGIGYTDSIQNVSGGNSQYVGTQQVSTTGENHKVAFKSSVYLNIPDKTEEESKATSYVQKIDAKSGTYGTYDRKSNVVYYDIKDLSQVKYATLRFSDVNISKYSKMIVRAVDQFGNNLDHVYYKTYAGKDSTFKQSNFGLQIEKDILQKSAGVKIEIESQGQVNAANDSGYNVADLTYLYNTEKPIKGKKVQLKDSSVKWESVKPVYSSEEELTVAEKAVLGTDTNYTRITKTIPVFPYVGNAIIKCYDKNGKVVRYFACAVKNNGKNENVLDTTDTTKAYIISEEEATASVGTVTDKGDGIVEVDSEKTGTTYLVGTVTCGDENVKIDADNEKVYTSVMWNPVADKTVIERGNFAAVEGQSVTFTAQLVDKNGNAVSKDGQAITWSGVDSMPAGATKITQETKTDVKGQAILKVNATDKLALQGIAASDDSKKYDVVLLLGNKKVSIADVYWVSLGLGFVRTVDAQTNSNDIVKTFDNPNGIVSAEASPINAGETWKYAAKVEAEKLFGNNNAATLNDKDWNIISTNGFDFKVAAAPNSKGKITINGTSATVSSDVNGIGGIINTLDSTLKTTGATMLVGNSSTTMTVPFVGEGAPNVSEELTISYNFGNAVGYSASFVNPTSLNKKAGTDGAVWLKVVDSKGNAYTNKKTDIVVKIDNGTASTHHVDEEGLVKIDVTQKEAGKSTTVTAKVGDLKEVETIVNWKNYLGFALEAMKFDPDAKTLKLTFNDDVYADSVDASEFGVSYKADGAATPKEYDVTVASVSGREVVLQLPKSNTYDWAHASEFDVTIKDAEPYKNSQSTTAKTDFKYTVSANKTGESVATTNPYILKGDNTATVGGNALADEATKAKNTATGKIISDNADKAIKAKDAALVKSVYAQYKKFVDNGSGSDDPAKVALVAKSTDLTDAYNEAVALDKAVENIKKGTYSLTAIAAEKTKDVSDLKVSDLETSVTKAAAAAGYDITLKDASIATNSLKENDKVVYTVKKSTDNKFEPVEVTVTVTK